MSDLRAKLERVLSDLGDSPETVASFLEGQGVKGRRYAPQRCPVAVYLQRVFPDVGYLEVGPLWIPLGPARVNTPPPIRRFIDAFDDGQFPALEIEEPKAVMG